MELGPSLAPELATAAAPLSRGLPEFLRPQGRAPDAASGPAPFEWLLQLLGNRLPERLPGGEILPAGGSALPALDPPVPGADPPPTRDPAAQGAAALMALPLPPLALAVPLPVVPAAPSNRAAEPQTALADALQRALAGAPRAQVAVSTVAPAPAPDTTSAAAAEAGALGTDAAAGPPTPGERPGAQAGKPAAHDALLALDAAARAAPPPAAEPSGLRPRAAGETRTRAPGVAPAERARNIAAELVRLDAAVQPRADASPERVFDLPAATPLQAPSVDGALPINLSAPTASADAPSAGSSAGFAPLAAHASGASGAAAAQPSAQLPAHLGYPVDTHSARWHEALASRIHWIVDHEIGEAQIKLNPPELGALDVKISMVDDKTYVQMTAHTSAARDELSQSLSRLRELMSAGGLDLGGATVSGGRDDRAGYQAAAQPVARALPFATDPAEAAAEMPRLRLASAARIDIFA